MQPKAMKSEDIIHMAQSNIDQEVENAAVTEERGNRLKLKRLWDIKTKL